MGVDSSALAARLDQGLQQQGFVQALNAMSDGRVVPLPGGVLLRDGNGTIIGALGVAGAASEQDEACALAAAKDAGLRKG